jgi:hypothetical protein
MSGNRRSRSVWTLLCCRECGSVWFPVPSCRPILVKRTEMLLRWRKPKNIIGLRIPTCGCSPHWLMNNDNITISIFSNSLLRWSI